MADCSGMLEQGKLDIEGLYRSTFRTKSYEDILKEFQEDQLNPTITALEEEEVEEEEEQDEVAYTSRRRPSPDHDHGRRLPAAGDFEEEDQQQQQQLEGLLPDAALQAPLRGLVRDYMESAAKADDFCCLLLRSIKRARADYAGVLRRVACVVQHKCDRPCEQRRRMFTDLARVAQLDNPLSQPELASSSATDGAMYAPVLIPQLRSLRRRVAAGRRSGFVGLCVKAAVGTSALLLPAAFGGASRRLRRCLAPAEQLGARLDEAARGGYVLDEEFQTVGRMLARVNEEIEHGRAVVREFLQGRPGRYPWREVVRLLQAEEGWLLGQLQELEQRAYLCLLTVDRARKALLFCKEEIPHIKCPPVI